ncbi:DUF349 domain-containing protein [Nanchangia anserum]|uniref:DUF349 domain-containing protein n=2 Tax=Nanchangia anserum TaxID=2692125 RepID=A0A8I0KN05_9ACTO|nr:DUF349 domain-containing protein [Nanchangia anserum]MBD3688761.1 DUF349 domain-containing protein [Nanchangia anserum]QOX82602.1 DUF349 domain-containing protein [Nanchangia anserum]
MRGPVMPTPAAPAPTPPAPHLVEAAKAFGRVDDQGRVWVREADGEREVGQFPEQVPPDPLQMYVRRYLELVSQVDLFEKRLPHLGGREIDQTLASLREQVEAPAAVGDLPGLRERVEQLHRAGEERKERIGIERAEAKKQARERRQAIVDEARRLAEQDPARTQWKQSGQRFRDLLEEWKTEQRTSPRLDRASEDELWKQFSSARSVFDKHRREFFSKLDAEQERAKRRKEQLIAEAERLSTSTEWGATAGAFRDLMSQWKAAGRASRRDDDALWERFNTAQQRFFDARHAHTAELDAQFEDNLKVKEELAAQAEALLPITDVRAARRALAPIQDAWDEAGMVPRHAMSRIDARMRAVEDALREAEEAEWRRTNPETQARAEGMAGQLQTLIAELEGQIEAARAGGDEAKVAELEKNLAARRAWLEQVQSIQR